MTPLHKSILIIVLLAVAGIGLAAYTKIQPPIDDGGIACTADAKICPDGSGVGRVGPNCEFAPCPEPTPSPVPISQGSGVRGIVLSGPQCPVMQVGVPCPDKPLQTSLTIDMPNSERLSPLRNFSSDKEGKFSIAISPGTYTISTGADSGLMFPCHTEPFVVSANAYTNVTVSCDTGIR
ncbi:MAG: hypothetical protein NUW02_01925 [Candidatus Campbellbacteria bacterium]|nr:hypothetical protein [Candidatus Campbellbacteria bacterium]